MAENVKLAPSGDARALKWCVIVAGIVAITSIYIAPLPSVQIRLISILPSLVQFVPSVPLISSETSDIEASRGRLSCEILRYARVSHLVQPIVL
jgi:hypothetical protein